jgi:hypothetical protein
VAYGRAVLVTYAKPNGLLLSQPVKRLTAKSRYLHNLEKRQAEACEAAKVDAGKVVQLKKREGKA